MKDPLSDLLSTRQLCAEVGVSRQTCMAWLKAGKIKPAFSMPGPTGGHYFSKDTARKMKSRNEK